MTEPIKVTPDALRAAADGHRAAAQYLRAVPATNAEIQQCLDSLGPVYAELREEARLKLDERRQNYEAQADDHENASANLQEACARWESHEQDAVAKFRALTEDT